MIELSCRIDQSGWLECLPELEDVALAAITSGAGQLGREAGQVSLLFTGDDQIRELNRTWRGKDKATDVLSFPAHEMDHPFYGDIAVSLETSLRDAAAQNKTLPQHLSHLLIHGFLHLMGHDHMNDTEAEEMEALERSALASLNWPDPYGRAV